MCECSLLPLIHSDVNQIEGVYALLPKSFPAVGGNEGVGRIVAVGPNVKELHVGDFVIPSRPMLGKASFLFLFFLF